LCQSFRCNVCQDLELEDQIEEEELNNEKEQKKETEATNKLEDDETTPIGKLLMKGKEVTKELVT